MRTLNALRLLLFAAASCGIALFPPTALQAQSWTPESPTAPYPPRQTIGILGEYSPDSSHIILGESRQRKFASVGAVFTERLMARRKFTLFYLAEVRPAILWSDPILKGINLVFTSPPPAHTVTEFLPQQPPVLNTYPRRVPFSFIDPYTGLLNQGTIVYQYGRRYLYAGGVSPVGFKVNLRPQTRVQPVFTGTGGVVISFRDLPMYNSSAFNFTFSFGAGLEWFRTESHSVRVEYRIQHVSNGYLGATNPGADSQVIQTTWNWGRH